MCAEDSSGDKRLSVEAIKRQIELLATPVDFDQLCRDGILERVGRKKYKVLDWQRLPKHVGARIRTLGPDGVTFEGTAKYSKMLRRIRRPTH